MFAALLNIRDEPIDLRQLPSGLEIVGRARRAALIAGPGSTSASLAGRYRIVGRFRLDARDELRARLGTSAASASDAMLCLQAYAKWHEAFTDFLAGDFAFALWDDETQCLLGARDRLGVHALFHSRTADAWLVSDSLDWLAARVPTRDALDDYWIADFLALGVAREFERTVYRDIKRLAPAHLLKLGEGGLSLRRYWRLDIPEPVYLHREEAFHERFRELLSRAVADRLPTDRVGVAMSGGLDSTTLAATAVEVTGDPSRIVAECEHYERLMHIREDHYASLAARHIGIELRIRPADDIAYDPRWRARALRSAEPMTALVNAHNMQRVGREMGAVTSVWLDGEGPDNALALERDAYLGWLRRQRSWRHLAQALVGYAAAKGLAGWVQTIGRHTRLQREAELEPADTLPPWLRRDFAERLNLAERRESLGLGGEMSHPWHPASIGSFTSPIWQGHFDIRAFEGSLGGFEWRYPYLDLRVLEFMLSVPPVPWGWNKRLIRGAMRGRLPAEVLARRKTPLDCYPEVATIREVGLPVLPEDHRIGRYVDPQFLPDRGASDTDLATSLNAHALDHWLACKRQ
ncbi:asparagine synthase-related protein [Reyranella sp.]|uniref:asparagine synthase-related protein n=1 Tax=Reyranella sp. TaxID=1929291 RepID=UPI0025D60744|nr:asparagine synthase-related protein [Reyranella sp.]